MTDERSGLRRDHDIGDERARVEMRDFARHSIIGAHSDRRSIDHHIDAAR